ncbi:MAG: tRNA(His) guanylyltransferase Thg1 family protein [bacterium]
MRTNQLEEQMRELEYFHSLRLLPGAWTVIRVDGRSFSRFTEFRFDKPFDERFRDYMIATATMLLEELHGIYAFTESDEISVLLPPEWDLFDRELEKVVSISAGIASAAFTKASGECAHFDSRIWLGVDEERVIDYFRWRGADATRCSLNGWCYWTLRKAGRDVKEATDMLKRLSMSAKQELLFQHGINFNDLPTWQRRGIGLYWEQYNKEGYNPITQESTTTTRRRAKTDFVLPLKDTYVKFLKGLLDERQVIL